MPVNLSVKNVPDALAARLRERAARNHRSLQGELMAILEGAASDPNVGRANAGTPGYEIESGATSSGGLMQRLAAIAGDRGIDTTKRLTREQSHDRKLLRKAGT
jgi:plasmid stability protein